MTSSQAVKVKINREGSTFGMEGTAVWDAKVGKWEVTFGSPWVGWYTNDEVTFVQGV